MNTKVLLVDDEPAILKGYQRNIAEMFESETAGSAEEAIEKITAEDKYALIVTDYRMPGKTGVDLLRKARELRPQTVRMLITGYADVKISLEAINEGSVFRMMTKPCDTQSFYRGIEDGLRQHELITAEKELLEQTLNGAVSMLGDILSVLDHGAFGRANKMAHAARYVAQNMGMEKLWEIEVAATLSEIGRVTLPGSIAHKRVGISEASEAELSLLKRMPEFSHRLLSRIPRLEQAAQIVLYQNKDFDGNGFPEDKLRGEYIPLGARILKVLGDVLLSLEQKETLEGALEKMAHNDNRYDREVVRTCERQVTELRRLLQHGGTQQKRLVSLKDLREGQRLVSNIETRDGVLIFTSGNIIRPAILQRIQNFATILPIKEPIEVIEP